MSAEQGITESLTRMSSRMVGDDYCLLTDPDASPSGVPFEVALMYAKQGRSVVREGATIPLIVTGQCVANGANHEDLVATDWLVLPKEESQ